MDPLTHSLVGAALAQSSRRKLSLAEAGALLIGANLPDLDALTYFVSQDVAFGFRRGWTHGPVGLVAGAPLLAVALLVADRLVRRVRGSDTDGPLFATLLRLAAIGIATHPLLDWLNTYGVRFLMPFSDRWFYGDALFIIDPWVWLLLGGGVFLSRPAIGRLEGIGWLTLALISSALIVGTGMAPPVARMIWIAGVLALAAARLVRSFRTPRTARRGMALAAVYAVVMVATSWLASAMVTRQLARDDPAPLEALMVGPVAANPLRWDVVTQRRDGYRRGDWGWLASPRLGLKEELVPKPAPTPIVTAALASPEVSGTITWMRFPFVEIEPDHAGPDRWTVRIMDLRYVRDRREGFGVATVTVDAGAASMAPLPEAGR